MRCWNDLMAIESDTQWLDLSLSSELVATQLNWRRRKTSSFITQSALACNLRFEMDINYNCVSRPPRRPVKFCFCFILKFVIWDILKARSSPLLLLFLIPFQVNYCLKTSLHVSFIWSLFNGCLIWRKWKTHNRSFVSRLSNELRTVQCGASKFICYEIKLNYNFFFVVLVVRIHDSCVLFNSRINGILIVATSCMCAWQNAV